MVEEYKIKILKQAIKDKENIKQYPALKNNVNNLLELIKKNPFKNPPPFETLIGKFGWRRNTGYKYSRTHKRGNLLCV